MTENKKISSTIIGASGEYHVMHEILKRGYLAALAPDGAPNSDIIVTDIKSEHLCSVQVKTRRDIGSDKGWHMKQKHEDLHSKNLFYCFVDVGKSPEDSVKTYVVPSKIVADLLKLDHSTWLSTPGKNGHVRKDSNMRRFKPDFTFTFKGTKYEASYCDGWLEVYREKWDLIVK